MKIRIWSEQEDCEPVVFLRLTPGLSGVAVTICDELGRDMGQILEFQSSGRIKRFCDVNGRYDFVLDNDGRVVVD